MSAPANFDWANFDLRQRSVLTEGMPASDALAAMASAVGLWREWDWNLIRSLLDRIEIAGKLSDERWLAADSPWRASATGRWLLADAWSRAGRKAEAITLLDEIVAAGGVPLAEALLARARLWRDLGNLIAARLDVRAAAGCRADFNFLTKAARLLDRLSRSEPLPGRPIKIAVLCSTTAELLTPLLKLACFREGMAASVYVAPYGSYRQEVIDAASGLYRFAPDVVIIGTHWRDASLENLAPDDVGQVERLGAGVSGLWKTLLDRHGCTILQHSFDLPACDAGGYLSAAGVGGRVSILRGVNAHLWANRLPGVVIVDLERISMEIGTERWEDPGQWHLAKQHPGPGALSLLVDHYVALIRAQFGLAKKVLVLDLDNTLWAGVVGEDGVAGLRVGPPTAIGEAHAALQTYAKELKRRGVLLAVCTKNNEVDARAPFRQHDGMVLKEDDFVAFVANWRDKSDNLRAIARALSVGLDSFVFVDDNPVERERIKRELPEVAVVDLGRDPATFVKCLHSTGWFESTHYSADDRNRHANYRANAVRAEARNSAATLEEFLVKLRMRMHHGSFNGQVLDRVVQLLGKTNQFNLTTRRHNLAEVQALMARAGSWTQYFRLTDCYGDNGIVGLMIAVPLAEDPDVWEVDTFLMSCRVIGRRAEDYMLRTLLLAAKSAGRTEVRGIYLPTAKNGLAANIYQAFGFAPDTEYAGPGIAYRWNLVSQEVPELPFIEAVGERETIL